MSVFSATDRAVEAMKAALEKRKTPDAALRVGVKGGGCAGFVYHLEYCDDEPSESDFVFEYDVVKVYVDKKSMSVLNGTELDWEEKMFEKGFKFNNPNAINSCGCNYSFDLKGI